MSALAKLLIGTGGGVPTVPGTPFEGGYYAGRIMIGGVEYALVVSPKAQGSAANLQWKTTRSTTAGTDSRNDGWSNTQAASTYHPAAEFCAGLNINGYDDWYLPSQDELEILYRAFKPTTQGNTTSSGANPSAIPPTGNYTTGNPAQTSVAEFRSGGGEDFSDVNYWSSTQYSSTWAWGIHFGNGYQAGSNKTISYQVRAVRRVAI